MSGHGRRVTAKRALELELGTRTCRRIELIERITYVFQASSGTKSGHTCDTCAGTLPYMATRAAAKTMTPWGPASRVEQVDASAARGRSALRVGG
jgi:hypothetical protein